MQIVSGVLGNLETDPDLAREAQEWVRPGAGCVEWVHLDIWQAQKARLRIRGDAGTDLGFDLERGTALRTGDVLLRDAARRHLVLVHVEGREVLTVRLLPGSLEERVATALKLGHLLGNQHWPVRLVGDTAYVPVLIDRAVMEAVLRTHALPGVRYAFEEMPAGMDLPLVFPAMEGHAHGADLGGAPPHRLAEVPPADQAGTNAPFRGGPGSPAQGVPHTHGADPPPLAPSGQPLDDPSGDAQARG